MEAYLGGSEHCLDGCEVLDELISAVFEGEGVFASFVAFF
jgi:hypothetical protein